METPSEPIIAMDPDIAQVHKYTIELSSLQDYELRILIAKYFEENSSNASVKKTSEESDLSLAEEIFESISKNLGGETAFKNAHKCQYPDFIKSLLEEIQKERISSIQKILQKDFNATGRKASQIAQARKIASRILAHCSN